MGFDITKFTKGQNTPKNQYEMRLKSLRAKHVQTSCIERAVEEAFENISAHNAKSFIIFGEPQSGKTEMMIALTAKLLDEGKKIIIHLLNDNVSLLEQNLKRFKTAGLAPAAVNFKEIIDKSVVIDARPFIIFCKKNQADLNNLLEKLARRDGVVVIDDEADFASPNNTINKGTKTKINALIEKILKKEGVYIGVTATPARLNLNSTFDNDHAFWVWFPPHEKYTGEKEFFPLDPQERKFSLHLISENAGEDPRFCREALFRFMVNSAYLNLHPDIYSHPQLKGNFTFLVHTSGKRIDHKKDFQDIQKIFSVLGDSTHKDYEKYIRKIWEIASERYSSEEDSVTQFVVDNCLKYEIKILNSDQDVLDKGTEPACPFTVIVGGNIISRGVTFDNLLSMYFTRDVKHKLQQDTYIQRARMFGSRGGYLPYFELTIPEHLYADWHKCFVFHRLALESIKVNKVVPVWLSDKRVSAVSAGSIDKANVALDSGEMSYDIFDISSIQENLEKLFRHGEVNLQTLEKIQTYLGDLSFPPYIMAFVKEHIQQTKAKVMLHRPLGIDGLKGVNENNISRDKGFMGGKDYDKSSGISHHFTIRYNKKGKARLFYKYTSGISFMKNIKKIKDGPK